MLAICQAGGGQVSYRIRDQVHLDQGPGRACPHRWRVHVPKRVLVALCQVGMSQNGRADPATKDTVPVGRSRHHLEQRRQ